MISVTNFVFPVVLGVTQLAIYLAKPEAYLIAVYVEIINFHTTTIGAVFATLWVAERRWDADRSDHHYDFSVHAFDEDSPRPISKHVTRSPLRRPERKGMPYTVNIRVSRTTEFYSSAGSSNRSPELSKVKSSSSNYELTEVGGVEHDISSS